MTSSVPGTRQRARELRQIRRVKPPGRVRLACRPFGEAGIGMVWSVLTVIVVPFVPAYLPFELVTQDLGPLRDAPGFVGLRFTVWTVLGAAAVAVLFGLVVGWILVNLGAASLTLTVLSFTYAVRSLRPAYAGERLSLWCR